MGVSMCSQVCNRTVGNLYDIERTEAWWSPDEESADDESGYLKSPMATRSITMPPELRRVLREASAMKRAKSGQLLKSSPCSLQDRMGDRRRSSVVDREMEHNARRYSEIVKEDSLKHLRHTIRIAGSIAEKGRDMNKELARQENVMGRAETGVAITEYETDQVSETLKAMSSLKRKFASATRKKRPKQKVISPRLDFDLFNREVGLVAFSRMSNCKSSIPSKSSKEDAQQTKLNEGFGHLHEALDVITIQQMDAAWALDRHEERLSVFEDQMTTTHRKINSQSRMINKIMGKC